MKENKVNIILLLIEMQVLLLPKSKKKKTMYQHLRFLQLTYENIKNKSLEDAEDKLLLLMHNKYFPSTLNYSMVSERQIHSSRKILPKWEEQYLRTIYQLIYLQR